MYHKDHKFINYFSSLIFKINLQRFLNETKIIQFTLILTTLLLLQKIQKWFNSLLITLYELVLKIVLYYILATCLQSVIQFQQMLYILCKLFMLSHPKSMGFYWTLWTLLPFYIKKLELNWWTTVLHMNHSH